jgi:hypothetical protein
VESTLTVLEQLNSKFSDATYAPTRRLLKTGTGSSRIASRVRDNRQSHLHSCCKRLAMDLSIQKGLTPGARPLLTLDVHRSAS